MKGTHSFLSGELRDHRDRIGSILHVKGVLQSLELLEWDSAHLQSLSGFATGKKAVIERGFKTAH